MTHASRRRTAHATLRCAAIALAITLCAQGAGAQAPNIALHDLDFYIHVDTLGGDPLSSFETRVDEALADARFILQGRQGPVDAPCCTEIIRTGSVQTFGTTGDGYDSIHFTNDEAFLETVAAGRDAVFVVDLLVACGGNLDGTAIGCAETPGSIQVVTTGALDRDLFGATVAHERGHNAGLDHATPNACDLMLAQAGGSCLPVADCTTFQSAATSTAAATCPCLANASTPLADGAMCTEGATAGICSGGVCGDPAGEAGVAWIASALDTQSFAFEDRLRGSGLTGDWQEQSGFGGGARPTGLAYAESRSTLYAVQEDGADGELLELDPDTGAVLSAIPIPGRPGLISLAWDPGGAGSADDRLLAVDRLPPLVEGMVVVQQIEELIEIDPDDGSTSLVCQLVSNSHKTPNGTGFFPGLAYDSANDRLFGNGEGGLFEIGPPPGCALNAITPEDPLASLVHAPGALAYSESTGLTFLLGNQTGPRTLFTVVDGGPGPGAAIETPLGIEERTLGGLAVVPAPEPATGVSAMVAVAAAASLRRLRRPSSR